MEVNEEETTLAWSKFDPRRAFVSGAAWREYSLTGATMWPGDREITESEANNRYPNASVCEATFSALRKDAERYRWLRTAGAWESEIGLEILKSKPEQFDAAVDAQMLHGTEVERWK